MSSRGRPRSFRIEDALDAAMKVFWRKGYEGASLTDLTQATGLNRPSLYAAFGDKESLFVKALDHYAKGPANYVQGALNQPTARAVAEHLLYGGVDVVTDPQSPRGCLIVQGALACGDGSEVVQREINLRRSAGEKAIRLRLQRAKNDGDLPAEANAADLARYLVTMMRGTAVLAAGGASRAELKRVVRLALCAWPDSFRRTKRLDPC